MSPSRSGERPGRISWSTISAVSRRHVRVARTLEGTFYAEDLGSTNGTFLGRERVGIALLRGGELLQLGPHLQLRFALGSRSDACLHPQVSESSSRDPLTHVFSRPYLNHRLFTEIRLARSTHAQLSLLMLDVDRFKDINDRFGHFAADRALCTIAARICAGSLGKRYWPARAATSSSSWPRTPRPWAPVSWQSAFGATWQRCS